MSGDIPWAEPWLGLDSALAAKVGAQLQREMAPGHVLEGCRCVAIGRRQDSDDVLFATEGAAFAYAIVHLTWRPIRERDAAWPHTTAFSSLDDWIHRCLEPDVAHGGSWADAR